MTRLLAVLDDSPAANPVLAVARRLAPLLGCEVAPLHLGGEPAAVVDRVVAVGTSADVVAVVIGAGPTSGGPDPLGGTALTVATRLPKPIVVVPPDAPLDRPLRRVLVPVEGPRSVSPTPQAVIDLAETAEVELIALHVLEQELLPAFTDQPQHEFAAWAQEFIGRYCHWHTGTLRLETRVGRARDVVPVVAEEVNADLVALGWSQQLRSGRARTVRAVLQRCRRPVLLVPVRVPAAQG